MWVFSMNAIVVQYPLVESGDVELPVQRADYKVIYRFLTAWLGWEWGQHLSSPCIQGSNMLETSQNGFVCT